MERSVECSMDLRFVCCEHRPTIAGTEEAAREGEAAAAEGPEGASATSEPEGAARWRSRDHYAVLGVPV